MVTVGGVANNKCAHNLLEGDVAYVPTFADPAIIRMQLSSPLLLRRPRYNIGLVLSMVSSLSCTLLDELSLDSDWFMSLVLVSHVGDERFERSTYGV